MSIADKYVVPAIVIGKVRRDRLKVNPHTKDFGVGVNGIIDLSVNELTAAWKGSLERLLKG